MYNFICPCSVSGPSWGCYWSACPVLITRLAGRTTGPDALGLSKRWRKGPRLLSPHRNTQTPTWTHNTHTRTQTLQQPEQRCRLINREAHLWAHKHVPAHVHAHTQKHRLTQAARPICSGTVYPSRSLAPDCQGELRRRRWHVVSSSARCAADTADRRKTLFKPKTLYLGHLRRCNEILSFFEANFDKEAQRMELYIERGLMLHERRSWNVFLANVEKKNIRFLLNSLQKNVFVTPVSICYINIKCTKDHWCTKFIHWVQLT